MSKISIIYFSQSGSTELLAAAIADGARQLGADVKCFRIRGERICEGRWRDDPVLQHLSDSDAIVFGSPTFMGGVSAQFKAFADATGQAWYQRRWKDKAAAGFTISNSPSGDKLAALQYFTILASQHGMIWVNSDELPMQPDGTNRLGSYLGLMAQNVAASGAPAELASADKTAANKFGQRIARVVRRLAAESEEQINLSQ